MPKTFLDKGMKYIYFAEANIPANLQAITVAQATAVTVKNLSDYAVVGSTTLQQDASDSIDERVYSDTGKVDIPTLKNGSGTGVYRRSFTALGAPDTDDVLNLFNARQKGLHLIFTGQGVADAPVAGDEYWYILLRADKCQPDNQPTGGFAKVTVEFKFAGDVGMGVIAA